VKTLAVLVFLAAGTGGGLWYFGVLEEKTEDGDAGTKKTHTVTRGTLTIALLEQGTLKTLKSTQIRSETNAKIQSIIAEGTKVLKDAVLVELDKTDATRELEQLVNQVTQLEAELKSATTEETIQLDQNKTDIEKAKLDLEIKTVELTKLMEADIPAEVRRLDLAIEEAETALERAEDDVKASERLLQEKFVTENDHKQTVLNLKKSKNSLETARMEKANYERFKRPLDERQKREAVEEATRGLERAIKRAEAQIASKNAIVTQKRVSLDRVKNMKEQKEKDLTKMTIVAPTDGTVLYGDPDNPWNNENIKVGAQVWNSQVLMTLPDSKELAATVEIHEADVNKVKVGMPVYITSEMEKGVSFDGKVLKIDAVPNAGRRWGFGENVKKFRVEVSLEGQNLNLKNGTSCMVEVKVGEVPDVLSVPLQAVFAREGKFYCFRRRNGKPERVEVETGSASRTYVEIKKGLEEKDEVLLHDPEIGDTDGAKAGGAPTPPKAKP